MLKVRNRNTAIISGLSRFTAPLLAVFALIVLGGCAATQNAANQSKTWKPTYRLQAGINKGGIVENREFEQLPGVGVDAFSGATRAGVNAGAHVVLPLFINAVETGIDFMYSPQTFTYNDAYNAYDGSRKLGTSQLMWPLTYNIGLLKNRQPGGVVHIKIGHVLQYNMLATTETGQQLPDYSISRLSNGATLGISATPFKLNSDARMGFYLDFYRGTRIFEDFYNSKDFEMPGSAFMKAGVIYQF
jgi:hypothetical protein